ncbi:MAG TPA: hypothetical protein VLZ54_11030, partial [Arenibacter sp.]|nr:hypothetical protein [Arenibacter sp.]
ADTVATENSTPSVEIGTVKLKDFKIDYLDEVDGMDVFLRLGTLELKMKELDLELMKFHIDRAAIKNTQISYSQTKSAQTDTDTPSSSTLPYFVVDHLKITNTQADYHSLPEEITAQLKVGTFVLNLPKADLPQRNIRLSTLELSDSEIFYEDKKITEVQPPPTTKQIISFEWPDWNIKMDNIGLENNRIHFQTASKTASSEGLDPSELDITKLDLQLSNIALDKESAQINLDRFSFYEKSGLALNNMAFALKVDQHTLSVTNLKVATPKSSISGNIKIGYSSIDTFLNHPEASLITVEVPSLKLALDELYKVRPQVQKNELFHTLAEKELKGRINLDGSLTDLKIKNTDLEWGQTTALKLNGSIGHPLEMDSLRVNLDHLRFTTDKQDMGQFISGEQLGIVLPDSLQLTVSLQGSLTDMATEAHLETSNGAVFLKGHFANKDQLDFHAQLEARDLELHKLLTNAKLGNTAFKLNIQGNGNNINTLNATLDSDITALEWDGYDFSNLKLTGDIKSGKGDVALTFKDKNLDAQLRSGLVLDSVAPQVNLVLNVKGADLSALGITRKDMRTQFKLQADFKGNMEKFTLVSKLDDALVIYDNTSYPIDDIGIRANIREKNTQVNIHSNMIQGSLISNSDPNALLQALQQQFKGYFVSPNKRDSIHFPITMNMDLGIRQNPILDDVILEGLKEMDSISVRMDFDEAQHKITARIHAPHINYRENSLDSLHLALNGTEDQLDFELGWASLSSGPVKIEKTTLKGVLEDRVLLLNFDAYHKDTTLAHITSKIQMAQDTLNLHIDPSGLTLNRRPWHIPANNQIVFAKKYMDFKDFVLERNGQKMTLSTTMPDQSRQHLGIQFGNFSLATFTSLLNPSES